jgi:hypothetical protein
VHRVPPLSPAAPLSRRGLAGAGSPALPGRARLRVEHARVAVLEDAARARLLTYRALLTLQVDSALGSPAAWDWPGRLGLHPPEAVVVQVEWLHEEADDTGEPMRLAR